MNPTPETPAPTGDYQAVLLLLTEIKADLRHALAEQAKHSESIEELRRNDQMVDARLVTVESKYVTAEAVRTIVAEAKPKNLAAWAGVAVSLIAVAVAVVAIVSGV